MSCFTIQTKIIENSCEKTVTVAKCSAVKMIYLYLIKLKNIAYGLFNHSVRIS